MTDYAQILKYVAKKGTITPAKLGGTVYLDKLFGSEVTKRCRELRAAGKLESPDSIQDSRFKTFRFTKKYAKEHARATKRT